MQQKFESNGCVYDVEIFHCGNTDIVRFYEAQNEQYGEMLSDLVIAVPSYGFLQIQYISGDAVLTGTFNNEYKYIKINSPYGMFGWILSKSYKIEE